MADPLTNAQLANVRRWHSPGDACQCGEGTSCLTGELLATIDAKDEIIGLVEAANDDLALSAEGYRKALVRERALLRWALVALPGFNWPQHRLDMEVPEDPFAPVNEEQLAQFRREWADEVSRRAALEETR